MKQRQSKVGYLDFIKLICTYNAYMGMGGVGGGATETNPGKTVIEKCL